MNSDRVQLRYRFGPFEVNARSGELRKHGVRLQLREQPFQILLMLLERPGDVVLRDEIIFRLWPHNTSVDFNHGINTCMKQLRDALSESAAVPRYLETVSRRGYRFLGDVEVVETPALPQGKRQRPFWMLVGAAALVFAGTGLVSFSSLGNRSQTVIPLTALPGVAKDPSISPDGARVAFSWGGDQQENVNLYVKDIGTGALVRLTTHPARDGHPAWAPDGRYVAFIRSERNASPVVMLIPPQGGPERQIAVLGPTPELTEVGSAAPLSWTPDSAWLAISARGSSNEARAIWLVSVDTGERRRLTTPGALEMADANPAVSPDGAYLAFSRGRLAQYSQQLHLLALTRTLSPAGDPRPLSTPPTSISGIAWASPREVVYSGGPGAAGLLWRLEVYGNRPPNRLLFSEDALGPSISAGSRRLVYAWRTWEGDIWRWSTRSAESKPLIVARGVQPFPQYSPDGRRIAFASTRSGEQEIWTCDSEGNGCAQLTRMRGPQTGAPHWSPDGRWLAFDSRPGGVSRIFKISAEGGDPIPLTTGGHDDFTPSWSSDANWIYFASDRGGRYEIWKLPVAGGPPHQLTTSGGYWPEEAPANSSVYYVKPGKPGLFRCPSVGGQEVLVIPRLATPQGWALSARGLYYFEPENAVPLLDADLSLFRRPPSAAKLRFIAFGEATSRVVGEIPLERLPRLGLSSSPDGEVLLGSWFRTRSDVMLVEQFR